MILLELFNRKVNISTTKQSGVFWRATAQVGDIKVDLEAEPEEKQNDDANWEVAFTTQDTSNKFSTKNLHVTGTGHEFEVFSAVMEMLKQFFAGTKPKTVTFTAEKSHGARADLYARMVDRMLPTNYTSQVDKKSSDYRVYFKIARKD